MSESTSGVVRSRLAKSIVAILLIFSVGGHWAVLQSVAWVTMVMDYSQDAPLSVAVEKTFGGKHPCGICKLVKKGKQEEEKREASKGKTKLDFWMVEGESLLPRMSEVEENLTIFVSSFKGRAEEPPAPPPRAV